MDLSNVTTVSDLVAANEQISPMETVIEGLKQLNFADTLEVATLMLNVLVEIHNDEVKNRMENGQVPEAMAWAEDAVILTQALAMVQQVESC